MTDEQHNKYIAWAFLGHAAFQLLMLLLMIAMFSMFLFIEPGNGQGPPPPAFFAIMVGFVSIFYLLFTLPSLIAGYGLLKRKSWARTASIVAAVLAAMNVPIGTAACVYSLWFFLGDNWKSVYPPQPTGNTHPQILTPGMEARWTGYQQDEQGEIIFRPVEPPEWR
jgi:hypothetical protein